MHCVSQGLKSSAEEIRSLEICLKVGVVGPALPRTELNPFLYTGLTRNIKRSATCPVYHFAGPGEQNKPWKPQNKVADVCLWVQQSFGTECTERLSLSLSTLLVLSLSLPPLFQSASSYDMYYPATTAVPHEVPASLVASQRLHGFR